MKWGETLPDGKKCVVVKGLRGSQQCYLLSLHSPHSCNNINEKPFFQLKSVLISSSMNDLLLSLSVWFQPFVLWWVKMAKSIFLNRIIWIVCGVRVGSCVGSSTACGCNLFQSQFYTAVNPVIDESELVDYGEWIQIQSQPMIRREMLWWLVDVWGWSEIQNFRKKMAKCAYTLDINRTITAA